MPKKPPLAKPDPLSNEVAIRAHIDQSGLTVAGKSRFLAASDRLLGGLVGIPGEVFEGIRGRMQARNEVREELIRADGRAARTQIEGMSEFGQLAIERFMREEFRKQENRFAVWEAAQEQLLLAAGDATSEASAATASDPPELEDDWINLFASYAEKASSDRLRLLWGRIMAGEVRRPGAFAPTTLRVIAEMDAEMARAFEDVFRYSVKNYALRPDKFEGEVLENYGFLEDCGLLHVDPNMEVTVGIKDGSGNVIGDKYLLSAKTSSSTLSFPVARITRVGLQIGTILERDELGALRKIAKELKPVDAIQICKIKAVRGDQFDVTVIETFPASA